MSTLKADAVTTKSDDTDLTITGGGTGVPNLEAGFKVGGTVGVPISGLQVGTDGELITWDASGDPAAVAVGTATHVLTSNGAGAAPTFQAAGGGFTLATPQATTSGTSFTFGSIPAGVTMLVMTFDSVAVDGGGNFAVQIGDAGGIETSGYVMRSINFAGTSTFHNDNDTASFFVSAPGASAPIDGVMTLSLHDSATNAWVATFAGTISTSAQRFATGLKLLSAELTQIQLSGGTFDEGSVNIMYQ